MGPLRSTEEGRAGEGPQRHEGNDDDGTNWIPVAASCLLIRPRSAPIHVVRLVGSTMDVAFG